MHTVYYAKFETYQLKKKIVIHKVYYTKFETDQYIYKKKLPVQSE